MFLLTEKEQNRREKKTSDKNLKEWWKWDPNYRTAALGVLLNCLFYTFLNLEYLCHTKSKKIGSIVVNCSVSPFTNAAWTGEFSQHFVLILDFQHLRFLDFHIFFLPSPEQTSPLIACNKVHKPCQHWSSDVLIQASGQHYLTLPPYVLYMIEKLWECQNKLLATRYPACTLVWQQLCQIL